MVLLYSPEKKKSFRDSSACSGSVLICATGKLTESCLRWAEMVLEMAAEVLGEEVVEAVISNTENIHQQDIEAAIEERRRGL